MKRQGQHKRLFHQRVFSNLLACDCQAQDVRGSAHECFSKRRMNFLALAHLVISRGNEKNTLSKMNKNEIKNRRNTPRNLTVTSTPLPEGRELLPCFVQS